MIDADGYRPNVGMIVCNDLGQVLWARRVREHAWQFPQGGVRLDETPEQAMFRELREEIGTDKVRILGRTRGWLRYDLPTRSVRMRARKKHYRGQKQIWFLLHFVGQDHEIDLSTEIPEFDQWRWVDYWMPVQEIIEFKRKVYQQALDELAPVLDQHLLALKTNGVMEP